MVIELVSKRPFRTQLKPLRSVGNVLMNECFRAADSGDHRKVRSGDLKRWLSQEVSEEMVQSSGKPEDPRSVPMIHVDKKLNVVGCVCLESQLSEEGNKRISGLSCQSL